MIAPTPARYEARKLPAPEPGIAFGLFDTFRQEFVAQFASWSAAVKAAGEHNRAYAKAMEP